MRRTLLFLSVIAVVPLVGFFAYKRAKARQARLEQPGPVLQAPPLKEVVLFNTGLGFFVHEGEIDGNARVELNFPTENINDLLKTLTVDDGGKSADITYDS